MWLQAIFDVVTDSDLLVTLPLTKLDGYFENTVFIALAANITRSLLHFVDDLRQIITFI
ncbi:hypothetical protein ACPV4B_11400 [Vibrio parahaemolyticus]|uniref:hypothetical protein n=1 Tax=Vibrio mediterranei TaxID=689 RepID=UPI0040691FEC